MTVIDSYFKQCRKVCMIYQGRFLAGTNDFAHMIKNTFFRQHVFIVIRIAPNDQKNAINFNGVMFFPPVI